MNYKLPYLFYFLSGATALVYEVVWARRLGVIFGADAYGVATVLAVFFLGLALGSFLAGKLQLGPSNALKRYGILEFAVGAYAMSTSFIFNFLENMVSSFSISPVAILISSIAVLILPTVLIGATFPTISKIADLDKYLASRRVGMLYGLNTLGAVIGAFIAGFFAIYFLGINMTIWVAALVNLVIAALAIWYGKRLSLPSSENSTNDKVDKKIGLRSLNWHNVSILTIFFLVGFSALALEVLWTRALVLSFGSSTFAFTLILSVFLLGIAFGSMVASRFLKLSENLPKWYVLSLLALGLFVILLIPIVGELPRLGANLLNPAEPSFTESIFVTFILSSMVLIVPTFLMGANFVVGIKVYTQSKINISNDVGNLYAVNTLGGVLGSISAAFLFLPAFGVQKSIVIAAAFYVLAAVLGAVFLVLRGAGFKRTIVVTSVVLLVVGFYFPSWNKHLLTSGSYLYFRDYVQDKSRFDEAISRGEILYYREGLLATLVVKRAPEGFIFLRTNGKADASTDQDLDDLHLIGQIPMILHPDAQNVLSVGLGSGITLGSIARHETAKNIEVVEIEPAMVEAAGYFSQYNNNVLSDSRLTVTIADARSYIAHSKAKYDVISSQPSNLWVRGNANLFTKEFFDDSRDALTESGLMLQWVPFYSFSEDDFKTTLATFTAPFPYVTAWTPAVSHDVLLVGSKKPQKFDLPLVDAKVKSSQVQADLSRAAIRNGEEFMGHYLFDQEQLKELVGDAKVNSDDKPILEYTSAFNLFEETVASNIELFSDLRGEPKEHFVNVDLVDEKTLEMTKKAIALIFSAKVKSASGRLEEAASELESALNILPKEQSKKELSRIYFELARKAYEAGDFAKTTSYFEKSVGFSPNAQVYLNLASIYASQNRIAKARDALNKAKGLEPNDPRIVEIEKVIGN